MGHLFQIAGSFPVIYISQCSVSTCLRCDGIFNDQFITQSLLNPRVKKNWKLVNICWSYGQLSTGSFFYETRCTCGRTLPLHDLQDSGRKQERHSASAIHLLVFQHSLFTFWSKIIAKPGHSSSSCVRNLATLASILLDLSCRRTKTDGQHLKQAKAPTLKDDSIVE